jgi:ATP-dependent Clp protease ATP-binding subunit ClpB
MFCNAYLWQILDDGRVTDGQGRLVSFKNCLIIMTSNLGSTEVYRHTVAANSAAASSGGRNGAGGADKDKVKELVMEQVIALRVI